MAEKLKIEEIPLRNVKGSIIQILWRKKLQSKKFLRIKGQSDEFLSPRKTNTEQKQMVHLLYVGLVVDNEEGVDLAEYLVVDGDAVEVLLEQRPQLMILLRQHILLLVQSTLIQQDLVVTLPEVLQTRILVHHLQGNRKINILRNVNQTPINNSPSNIL